MVISFETAELQILCARQEVAEQRFGKGVAQQLHNRLSDIEACDNIFELLIKKPIRVTKNRRIEYRFDLGDGICLVLSSNQSNLIMDELNEIDWRYVYRVKVTHVGRI